MMGNTTCVTIAILALAALGRPALAIEPKNMPGRWSGYGASIQDQHTIIPCFDVDPGSVKNRRFKAMVEDVTSMDLDCTLSESGILDGSARLKDLRRLELHGRVREMDGWRIMALSYKTWGADGKPSDEGYVALIQMNGGADWNHTNGAFATGFWDGSYTPEGQRAGGRMTADLVNVRDPRTEALTTAMDGTVSLVDVFVGGPCDRPASLNFPVKGTTAPPDPDVDPLIPLIGVSDSRDPATHGIVTLITGNEFRARGMQPATYRGTYRLYHSFYDLYTELVDGTERSFDKGSFSISLPAM